MDNNILCLLESERKRIADDLHDTTVQELVHLSQQLDLTNLYFEKDLNQAKLELMIAKKNIKEIIDGMRSTIYDLRPMTFDDLGWNSAFDRLYNDLSRNDINVIFDINKSDYLNEIISITIYRIIKEACYNTMKHADAKNLSVKLYYDSNNIFIDIIDDGKGFNVNEVFHNQNLSDNHFGLKIMYERVKYLNGSINFTSSTSGTIINIIIPIL